MIVKANAKVNLSLDITGKRPDGYHSLCSVMQSVSLSDKITVDKSNKIIFSCSDNRLNGNENLAVKACEMFLSKAKINMGAEIHIEKRIPVAGGLGGGSTDAAAVLLALNKLYCNPLTFEELSDLALKLGADVPFCLKGGTALAKGIGEELTYLSDFPMCWIVISVKGSKSSTYEMYNRLDSSPYEKESDLETIINGINRKDAEEALKGAYNCFESVCDNNILKDTKLIAAKTGAIYCGLSGAGPSFISVYKTEKEAITAAGEYAENKFLAYLCCPTFSSFEIIE